MPWILLLPYVFFLSVPIGPSRSSRIIQNEKRVAAAGRIRQYQYFIFNSEFTIQNLKIRLAGPGGKMEERSFGNVRFIPGKNKGKYPFCHSLYLEGAKVLIDPASDRERLIRLREESGVEAVWLTHWHEDHFMHLDLFEDVPLYMSEPDAPMLSDIECFLDGYGIESEDMKAQWRDIVIKQFHFRPRKPAGYLRDKQVIRLNGFTVEVIHTPGHTPGHLAFYIREPGVLFLGDYDLTKFGPWYGDRASSIQDTIRSVERLRRLEANVWIAGHETGVFDATPDILWDNYISVIGEREEKLLAFLTRSRTMEEIVNAWIVYRKPREPKEFYAFTEQAIISKHLDLLMVQSRVEKKNGTYFLLR